MVVSRRRSQRIKQNEAEEKQVKPVTPVKEEAVEVSDDESENNDQIASLELGAGVDAEKSGSEAVIEEDKDESSEEKEEDKSDDDEYEEDGDEDEDESLSEEEEDAEEEMEDERDETNEDVDVDRKASQTVQDSEKENKSTKRKSDAKDEVAGKKPKTDSEGELVTLLLTNLPSDTTEEVLNSFLNGNDIKLSAARTNFSRGKAFIDINSSDQEKGLRLDQVEWNNKKISVVIAARRSESSDRSSKKTKPDEKASIKSQPTKTPLVKNLPYDTTLPTKTLLVKNLPYNTTQKELKSTFDNVHNVRMVSSKYDGKPRGMAYVVFVDVASANKVMNKVDGYELGGRKMSMEYADHQRQRHEGESSKHDVKDKNQSVGRSANLKTLFLKGETGDVSMEELKSYFKDAVFLHTFKTAEGKISFSAGVKLKSKRRPPKSSFVIDTKGSR